MIEIKNLSFGYNERLVIKDLSLNIEAGKITALVGKNGCGKSTLLKCIARILKANSGEIFLDGRNIKEIGTREMASMLAFMPQNPIAPEGFTVGELVSYGRFPYRKRFGALVKEDYEIIDWSLKITEMTEFSDRSLENLSGGQRQKAWIAMALAQKTDVILLDEPTTFLDMAHQYEVLNLLKKLNQEHGYTIVMVVHDLNHATFFADNIAALKDGKLVRSGKVDDIISEGLIEEVFGVHSSVMLNEKNGAKVVIPYDIA